MLITIVISGGLVGFCGSAWDAWLRLPLGRRFGARVLNTIVISIGFVGFWHTGWMLNTIVISSGLVGFWVGSSWL